MKYDATTVLHTLTTTKPTKLQYLPKDHGIYALRDHDGAIRYIGITKSDKHGFFGRINNRHTTGSESRSHKFSHAYNTGRMWRGKKDSSADAKKSKELRKTFIRMYCSATYVVIPEENYNYLTLLEQKIYKIAPPQLLKWGNRREFFPLPEPKEHVDALLLELDVSAEYIAAVERQASLQALSSSMLENLDESD